jgi:CheY-like chemotaxis protein
MEDDPKKVKEGLLTLNNMVRQLDFSINNVLNISSLDVQKIKVVDNKYDLEKLCRDLEIKIKPEVNKNVEFVLSMPKQLPILYGDYMKIRQILYSLLTNTGKNTENGKINMKVNVIEKYDICRVVFNISDTGCGMPIEQINEILSATGSLDKTELDNLEKKEFNVKLCQKVVKIMGGNLMIKSNIGEGTDIVLTLDQKVFHEKDNSILTQYENDIANYRKVLIVSQNKDVVNVIKKKLADNHITYSNLYYGADAIDRIKSGKKFDFILVEDEMAEMTGFMTFKGMCEIKGFNTPVIIMLKGDKEHIKDHYLEDGFKDYVLLSNLDNELDRIIEKY